MALKYLDTNVFKRSIFEAQQAGIKVSFDVLNDTVKIFDLNDLELAVFFTIYIETKVLETKAFIRNTEQLSKTFAYTLNAQMVDFIIRSLAEKGCIKAILPEKDAKFGTYVCVSVC